MIAYKGFEKNLTCRGYHFTTDGINRTKEANCRRNGLHCAENPLDCLAHYPKWDCSVYYIVEALGDVDETDRDSQIACTELRLLKELTLQELLLEGAGYMAKYPERCWSEIVRKESGRASNGYVIVRGKNPTARGRMGSVLVLVREEYGNANIRDISVFQIDGKKYLPDTWYDIDGILFKRKETA